LIESFENFDSTRTCQRHTEQNQMRSFWNPFLSLRTIGWISSKIDQVWLFVVVLSGYLWGVAFLCKEVVSLLVKHFYLAPPSFAFYCFISVDFVEVNLQVSVCRPDWFLVVYLDDQVPYKVIGIPWSGCTGVDEGWGRLSWSCSSINGN
jgi:hypothetical protein